MEGSDQLEIKVVSAKDLWAFNFFQKLCIYTAVSLFSDSGKLSKDQIQEQRTATDPDGDGHPHWDHPMTFRLSSDLPSPISDLFLKFDLRHHAGLLFPDRTIGEVKVPLSDLLESSDAFRFVDYQVRSPDGKPNGVLRLAYKLNRVISGDPYGVPVSISGYPQINPDPLDEKPSCLYPSADLWDPSPVPESRPPEHQTHLPAEVSAQPAPQYPALPPPMWAPPPPPPPFWGPLGFMHRPPPPPIPPPGYFHYPWSQQNNGR